MHRILMGQVYFPLAAAISMIIEGENKEVDVSILLKHLWDTGKMFSDVFHQFTSVCRSYILCIVDQANVSLVKESEPGKYLFGEDLCAKLQLKKTIDKAATDLVSTVTKENTPLNSQRLP